MACAGRIEYMSLQESGRFFHERLVLTHRYPRASPTPELVGMDERDETTGCDNGGSDALAERHGVWLPSRTRQKQRHSPLGRGHEAS